MIPLGVFLFGLVIGSFLNVCILRIPADKSIVMPASSCPKCGKGIAPYDNIPVLSWLILGGKCRNCKTKISAMYPAVELLTGLLFLACYFAFGLDGGRTEMGGFRGAAGGADHHRFARTHSSRRSEFLRPGQRACSSVFSLTPIDGTALWLANRWFAFPPPAPAFRYADSILGAVAGSGLLWLVAEGYFRLRGREGMGLGDVKMMAAVGAFLGLKRTLMTSWPDRCWEA